MTRSEIATLIAGIGLPNAYNHFSKDESPSGPPFILFYYPALDDFFADNINYASIAELVVEFYTDNVDFTKEAAIEAALNGADLAFSMSRDWIDDERMYQTTYVTSVLLTDEPPAPPDDTENNTEVLEPNGE